jgi:hypothetical protein
MSILVPDAPPTKRSIKSVLYSWRPGANRKEVVDLREPEQVIALTFDDVPDSHKTNLIVTLGEEVPDFDADRREAFNEAYATIWNGDEPAAEEAPATPKVKKHRTRRVLRVVRARLVGFARALGRMIAAPVRRFRKTPTVRTPVPVVVVPVDSGGSKDEPDPKPAGWLRTVASGTVGAIVFVVSVVCGFFAKLLLIIFKSLAVVITTAIVVVTAFQALANSKPAPTPAP